VIAERGFDDTRIADVAERVGASPALVVYYFGTKDKLLTEALRSSEEAFYSAAEEMLAANSGIVPRLETLVSWTCLPEEQERTPGTWGLWFDLWAQAFRHPEVKKDRVELDQRWRDMISRVVREGDRGARDRGHRRRAVLDRVRRTAGRLVDPDGSERPGGQQRGGLPGGDAVRRIVARVHLEGPAQASAPGDEVRLTAQRLTSMRRAACGGGGSSIPWAA
jgi:AcrR family transcriptional regulator